METKKVALSSIRMALATSISRLLGLGREQALAFVFGAGQITDAFAVAYRIPNMLRDLLAEGALSSSFVPVFVKEHLRDKSRAASLLWSLFILLLLTTGLLSGLLILGAESVVRLVTSDSFASEAEAFQLTVTLTQIMAPFLCFVSLAALMMGVLNSLKFFFIPALSPAIFNVAMILAILFVTQDFSRRGIPMAYALGWGVFVGGLLQFLVQLPFVLRLGFRPRGRLRPFGTATRPVLKNMGLGTLAVAATQINVLVSTVLATGIGPGAVSWLTYAFRLFQLPIGVLSVSLAGSNLVHFSDAWKRGDGAGACRVLKSGYNLSWMTALPAFVLLFVLAEPSVKILLERGAFDQTDTYKTALALKAYALGLPFYGLYKILTPTFFSLDRANIPVFISLGAISVNIFLCLLLVPTYGLVVLPLGTSVSMVLNVLLQVLFLKRHLGLGGPFFVDKHMAIFLLATFLCFVSTHSMAFHTIHMEAPVLSLLGQTILVAFVGLGVYGAFLWGLLSLCRKKNKAQKHCP